MAIISGPVKFALWNGLTAICLIVSAWTDPGLVLQVAYTILGAATVGVWFALGHYTVTSDAP